MNEDETQVLMRRAAEAEDEKKRELKPVEVMKIERAGLHFTVVVNRAAKVVVAKLTSYPAFHGPSRNKGGKPILSLQFVNGWGEKGKFTGMARCGPEDTWNEGYGINIAIQRCWRKAWKFMELSMLDLKDALMEKDKNVSRIPMEEFWSWPSHRMPRKKAAGGTCPSGCSC